MTKKCSTPENFAKQNKAVVVASAGCGKTHLIAESVACCSERQLVLTHTHAGEQSLRNRMQKLGISSSLYKLETIHSFALRYAAAYPKTSLLKSDKPETNEEYVDVISSASKLFECSFIKEVLKSSYSGMFVDEYQDCSVEQHQLICNVADILPCRIVGDPLQGIFDFGENKIVNWERDVFPVFEKLEDLTIPYRWKDNNPQLGEWLTQEVRPKLLNGQAITFNNMLPNGCSWHRTMTNYTGELQSALADDDYSIFVITEPENVNRPHSIAKNLKNTYKTIEPVTSDKIFKCAQQLDNSKGKHRLKFALGFADICLTAIKSECNEVLKSLDGKSKNFRNKRKLCLLKLYECVINENGFSSILKLYQFLETEYKPTIKRYQLWQEMKKGLEQILVDGSCSLEEAIWMARNKFKFAGKYLPKRCISRTLLLKGLECDHAIILDAHLLSTKNLYVALTRPSKKLTVYSNNQTLNPV